MAAVVLLAVSLATAVSAHEAHNGMKYDQECCHDNDCAPAIESHQEGMDLVITTIHGTMRVTPAMTWVKRLPSEYFVDHIRVGSQPMLEPENDEQFFMMLDAMHAEQTLVYSSDSETGGNPGRSRRGVLS